MSRIFFYGLFMDVDLLEGMGIRPSVIGPAELPEFQIRIGDRATLVPNHDSTAYGIVMELTNDDAATLYSKPGVSDYRPEEVSVILTDDRSIVQAVSYNLPLRELKNISNVEYAEKLAALVLELGFSAAYANEIAGRSKGLT